MQNLNPYNKDKFRDTFILTNTYKELKKDYHYVSFDKFLEARFMNISTPRQHIGLNWASAVPWYYLNYLDFDSEMVDLGCGYNFFKKYFHSVIGIGAEDREDQFFGDVHDFVDDEFFQNHVDAYNSVFSINALHFHPLETIRTICENFCNMIKPGGRGFLALNAQRMIERGDAFKNFSSQRLDQWIRSQFNNFPNKILVFDVDLATQDAWLDGNIRIVFER